MKFRTIGERITYARELKGLKKNQLAREVKVSPAAVTQWEQGDTKGLKPANLVAVAHALGVLTDWLAAEVGPMNPIITVDEIEVLEEYRALDPEKKPVARMTIRAMRPPLAEKTQIQAQSQTPNLEQRTG